MKFEKTFTAKLIERENRFMANVDIQGEIVKAHVPNSGRCRELLFPGNEVLLQEAPPGANRKTRYSVILARHGRIWVCLVSVWANTLTQEAFKQGLLPELRGYSHWKPEVRRGSSRLDFQLAGEDDIPCLVEVKGVTLVQNERAIFPDAPTSRGARHLSELAKAVTEGYRGVVVFTVQRQDASVILPNYSMDPVFSKVLQEAVAKGVTPLGFCCKVSPSGIEPLKRLPVLL